MDKIKNKDEDVFEQFLNELDMHMNEELPPGVEFDGERYIIDEDSFKGWY